MSSPEDQSNLPLSPDANPIPAADAVPPVNPPPSADPAPVGDAPKPGDPKAVKPLVRDARAKGKPGGDVNVANIGEGAQVDQIAVGRNILQAKVNIGSLVIPVRFLLALLAVVAIGAVVVWWIVVPGKMPSVDGKSNIAVVEFAEQDANGKPASNGQGAYLSQWLADHIGTELGGSAAEDKQPVWHIATSPEPIHLFEKRYTSGPILTDADAQRVMDQFGADILIYGTVEEGDNTYTFKPQVKVKDPTAAQEAPELSGSQQMGKPVPLAKPVTPGTLETSLQPIGRTLYWIARGLTFDLVGNFTDGYRQLKLGQPEVDALSDEQGKEVFYYFKGTEALFLAQCERDAATVFTAQPDRSAMEQALDEAQHDYETAIEIQPAYARAYFGLGQVASQRGQRLMFTPDAKNFGQCRVANASSTDPSLPIQCPEQPPASDDPARLEAGRKALADSIQFHQKALDLMQNSKDTLLLHRIQSAQASSQLALAQALLVNGNLPDAETQLKTAFDTLDTLTPVVDANQDPRGVSTLQYQLGVASFLQGYTRLMQNDPDGFKDMLKQADNGFQMCLNTIQAHAGDVYLRERLLPNCTCAQIDARKAAAQ